MVAVAGWLVNGLLLYLAVGVVFGIPFVWRGVHRIDPAAPGSSWGFRLLNLPGVAALWPLLALRWMARTDRFQKIPGRIAVSLHADKAIKLRSSQISLY